jgi:hypothetical protein
MVAVLEKAATFSAFGFGAKRNERSAGNIAIDIMP